MLDLQGLAFHQKEKEKENLDFHLSEGFLNNAKDDKMTRLKEHHTKVSGN